jgi:hypothetical protein
MVKKVEAVLLFLPHKFYGVNPIGMPWGKSSKCFLPTGQMVSDFFKRNLSRHLKIILSHFYRTTPLPAMKKHHIARG